MSLRILSSRLTSSLPLDPRQKAFRPVDGCADNLFLLDTIIKDAQRRRRPLSIAFIDVAKAFDSVSHYILARSLRRLGFQKRWWNTLVTCTTTHLLFPK